MADPRGHHLLPQTYQRGFANAKNQVRIVDRETGEGYTVSVRDAFKRRDWNAVKDEDGRLDHTAERLLAEYVDDPASPGLQQLRNGDLNLSDEDRLGVGVFIAAQMGRTPGWREAVNQFHIDLGRRLLALAAQHYSDERWEEITGERPTPEMRDRIARQDGFEITIDKSELFISQQVAHDVGPMVAAMSWTLVEFVEPWLFASGLPVMLLAQTPPPPMMGLGLGTADATYVPVSPSRALWIQPVDRADRVVAGNRALARRLNFEMLIAPLSAQLLLSPDAAEHPLPATRSQTGFPVELLQPPAAAPKPTGAVADAAEAAALLDVSRCGPDAVDPSAPGGSLDR